MLGNRGSEIPMLLFRLRRTTSFGHEGREDRPVMIRRRRSDQKLLATIIFLIPAIAFAGFNPFGQAVVQFMMV